jgi:hypothetical protein
MTDNNKLAIIPPHKWPAGATADGNLYSLQRTPSMDIRYDLDPDDFSFAPIPTVFYPEDLEEFRGTYAEVARKASYINETESRLNGKLSYIAHPVLVSKLAA